MTPLAVENVVKQYRQGDKPVAALGGVSLDVRQGQFLAIMGASGSGKSTLLYLMAGLTRPDEGRVLINGTDIGQLNDRVAGLGGSLIPADLVTASGSGLDPDISPAGALFQVARVARARNLGEDRLRQLIAANIRGPDLGILGEPRVNVLALNLALDELKP